MTAITCGACHGAGGHTEDTSTDRVTRLTWRTCRICRGKGSR